MNVVRRLSLRDSCRCGKPCFVGTGSEVEAWSLGEREADVGWKGSSEVLSSSLDAGWRLSPRIAGRRVNAGRRPIPRVTCRCDDAGWRLSRMLAGLRGKFCMAGTDSAFRVSGNAARTFLLGITEFLKGCVSRSWDSQRHNW